MYAQRPRHLSVSSQILFSIMDPIPCLWTFGCTAMKVRRHILSKPFNGRRRSGLSFSERASQPSTPSVSGNSLCLCFLVVVMVLL